MIQVRVLVPVYKHDLACIAIAAIHHNNTGTNMSYFEIWPVFAYSSSFFHHENSKNGRQNVLTSITERHYYGACNIWLVTFTHNIALFTTYCNPWWPMHRNPCTHGQTQLSASALLSLHSSRVDSSWLESTGICVLATIFTPSVLKLAS